MAKLDEQAKEAILTNLPALVATAGKDGMPNVSAKGSLRVLDDDHVMFADVFSPRTTANIKENPQVSLICLGSEGRKGIRIWGNAKIMDSGDLFESISKEFADNGKTINNVIKIHVDEIEM